VWLCALQVAGGGVAAGVAGRTAGRRWARAEIGAGLLGLQQQPLLASQQVRKSGDLPHATQAACPHTHTPVILLAAVAGEMEEELVARPLVLHQPLDAPASRAAGLQPGGSQVAARWRQLRHGRQRLGAGPHGIARRHGAVWRGPGRPGPPGGPLPPPEDVGLGGEEVGVLHIVPQEHDVGGVVPAGQRQPPACCVLLQAAPPWPSGPPPGSGGRPGRGPLGAGAALEGPALATGRSIGRAQRGRGAGEGSSSTGRATRACS
jgi:hypothetical protein